MKPLAPIVIAGSGLAGYNLARELRKRNRDLPITIVTRDDGGYYSKPMLSNALASGKSAVALITKSGAQMASEIGADLRTRAEIAHIDVATRQLVLDRGARLTYSALALAIGADPIRLPLRGNAAAEVLSVNDVDDYARFASALAGARRVVILGAGLIGCEFANDLLARGIRPTVLDIADRPLARLLPEAASARMQRLLAAAGIEFLLCTSVVQINRARGALTLTLGDGSALAADLVLSGIGLQPRVALAQAAGLAIGRGISVDRLLATSAPGVWALGDCAEVEHQHRPYVMPLMHQARALAATLAGTPTPVVYPPMPIVVKTPACPTIVCPPPVGSTAGAWTTNESAEGLQSEFIDGHGRTLGFVLMGSSIGQRATLTSRTMAATTTQ